MRKTTIVITVVLCLVFSTMPIWADTVESVRPEIDTETPYTYAGGLSAGLSIAKGNAVCTVAMPIKAGKSFEYAQVNAYIKKYSGATVKSFSQKVKPMYGKVNWQDTYKLTSRGTYYLHVVVKCYKSGKVVETITENTTGKRY
mgnify:CR=1 FL=1